MTPGERYCDGILVRVVCDGPRPFCAGLLIDRATDRVVFAAPILRHLMGQPADKLRQGVHAVGLARHDRSTCQAGAG